LEIYPQFGVNFVLGFAFVTIRRSEAYAGTVSISHLSTCGMSGARRILQHIQILYAADTVSLCGVFGYEAT
jgi:hypothetical protein